MKIEEIQNVFNQTNKDLVDNVNNSDPISGSELKILSILILHDRGVKSQIADSVKKLEEARGTFNNLARAFFANHNLSSFEQIKISATQGSFIMENSNTNHKIGNSFIAEESLHKTAGEHLHKTGSIILEWLIIAILLVSGMTLSALSNALNPSLFSYGYIIYGIYSLVCIIRLANNLKRAGESLMGAR